jgi:hypothetical protein
LVVVIVVVTVAMMMVMRMFVGLMIVLPMLGSTFNMEMSSTLARRLVRSRTV